MPLIEELPQSEYLARVASEQQDRSSSLSEMPDELQIGGPNLNHGQHAAPVPPEDEPGGRAQAHHQDTRPAQGRTVEDLVHG